MTFMAGFGRLIGLPQDNAQEAAATAGTAAWGEIKDAGSARLPADAKPTQVSNEPAANTVRADLNTSSNVPEQTPNEIRQDIQAGMAAALITNGVQTQRFPFDGNLDSSDMKNVIEMTKNTLRESGELGPASANEVRGKVTPEFLAALDRYIDIAYDNAGLVSTMEAVDYRSSDFPTPEADPYANKSIPPSAGKAVVKGAQAAPAAAATKGVPGKSQSTGSAAKRSAPVVDEGLKEFQGYLDAEGKESAQANGQSAIEVKADGIKGGITTGAIRRFQEEQQLAVTGKLDEETKQLLRERHQERLAASAGQGGGGAVDMAAEAEARRNNLPGQGGGSVEVVPATSGSVEVAPATAGSVEVAPPTAGTVEVVPESPGSVTVIPDGPQSTMPVEADPQTNVPVEAGPATEVSAAAPSAAPAAEGEGVESNSEGPTTVNPRVKELFDRSDVQNVPEAELLAVLREAANEGLIDELAAYNDEAYKYKQDSLFKPWVQRQFEDADPAVKAEVDGLLGLSEATPTPTPTATPTPTPTATPTVSPVASE